MESKTDSLFTGDHGHRHHLGHERGEGVIIIQATDLLLDGDTAGAVPAAARV